MFKVKVSAVTMLLAILAGLSLGWASSELKARGWEDKYNVAKETFKLNRQEEFYRGVYTLCYYWGTVDYGYPAQLVQDACSKEIVRLSHIPLFGFKAPGWEWPLPSGK